MNRITDTVKTLLIANVLFYIGSLVVGNGAYHLLALWYPENPNFHFWQLLTHMFMHDQASILHIFFNMFMLFMFGSVLEMKLGQSKFLFIYFSAGFGAAGLQLLFNYYDFNSAYQTLIDAGATASQIQHILDSYANSGQPLYFTNAPQEVSSDLISSYFSRMVGASGAISGVLAAFAFMYPNLPLMIIFFPVPIKAKYLIGGYFLLDLFSAVTGSEIMGQSNVAHWAHLGGAIVGLIIMWVWRKNQFNQNRWN
jgi:membrane associated rhomboid family serine protease